MSSFNEKFRDLRKKNHSLLCVGLDPEPRLFPSNIKGLNISEKAEYLLKTAIEAVLPFAIAWKPNLAFFESLGGAGYRLLEKTLFFVRESSPESLVILDGKRGDIGNTARHYAKAAFEELQGDALTLNPYMGLDTLEPYLEYKDKAVILLCHTSNPGADWLQSYGKPPLYLHLATNLASHPHSEQIWLVVGATKSSKSIQAIRKAAPNLPFLVPGIGAQGGDLVSVLSASGPDVLINAGRSILYASNDIHKLPKAASATAESLVQNMQDFLIGTPRRFKKRKPKH